MPAIGVVQVELAHGGKCQVGGRPGGSRGGTCSHPPRDAVNHRRRRRQTDRLNQQKQPRIGPQSPQRREQGQAGIEVIPERRQARRFQQKAAAFPGVGHPPAEMAEIVVAQEIIVVGLLPLSTTSRRRERPAAKRRPSRESPNVRRSPLRAAAVKDSAIAPAAAPVIAASNNGSRNVIGMDTPSRRSKSRTGISQEHIHQRIGEAPKNVPSTRTA